MADGFLDADGPWQQCDSNSETWLRKYWFTNLSTGTWHEQNYKAVFPTPSAFSWGSLPTQFVHPAGASAPSIGNSADGAAVAAAVPLEEDDTANLLGLPVEDPEGPGPAKKRRISAGAPKIKKSREEIFAEEVAKIRGKYEELVNSMQEAGSTMPTVANVAKLQRSVVSKKTEAKDHGSFETTTALEDLDTGLQNFKEALRLSGLYLPPSGPRKSHADSFVTALQNLTPGIREKFPESILSHYRHLCHLKDTQGHVWARSRESQAPIDFLVFG